MDTEISWQKSSFSGGGGEQCVEVARRAEEILLRESDDPRVITRTSRDTFAAFIQGVKAGEYDHFVH
ncbi:DUF397 domain-containing protein [Streptomyces sp. NPDC052042]|uniref:DUF397 domain-containing protein n=1 Tax=Streptomyces sp. NPDC052042 TaxID=3365683 RepID=UPI0037D7E24D